MIYPLSAQIMNIHCIVSCVSDLQTSRQFGDQAWWCSHPLSWGFQVLHHHQTTKPPLHPWSGHQSNPGQLHPLTKWPGGPAARYCHIAFSASMLLHGIDAITWKIYTLYICKIKQGLWNYFLEYLLSLRATYIDQLDLILHLMAWLHCFGPIDC